MYNVRMNTRPKRRVYGIRLIRRNTGQEYIELGEKLGLKFEFVV